MIVLRLQNEDGRGPYSIRRPSSTDWGYPAANRPKKRHASYLRIEWDDANGYSTFDVDPHPAPYQDGLARVPGSSWSALDSGEYCGFESEEQMRAWFFREPHDPEALHDMGLLVTEWKVHGRYVRKGGHQLVFFRDKAELLRTMSPLEFPVEVLA